jgi:cyclic pyranopterin phosphate synthase
MLVDSQNRVINYLRVSVTDRCNLRCIYCMSRDGVDMKERSEILSFEEIERIISAAAEVGISKIRLTGGEPLIRKGIIEFIERISKIPGISDLSMTTNGILLKNYAAALKKAGLQRINISLDTLMPEKYREITENGEIDHVWEGIFEAERAGLCPVKINLVVVRGLNDDELAEFANLTKKYPFDIRFIEYMPIGSTNYWSNKKFVPSAETLERISKAEKVEPIETESVSTAKYYKFAGSKGRIGLISPISSHFCTSCNKLRLTSDGRLRTCLFSDEEIDLKAILRSDYDREKINDILKEAVLRKPEAHNLKEGKSYIFKRTMSEIGG